MNYSQAIKYLYEQLPMYQRVGPAAYKNNLDNTLALDSMFGNPHRNFKTVHVAGTNGKGSVSHMLASVLQSAGYKVGLYTSPHLKDYRERIKINGQMIPEEKICRFLERFIDFNSASNVEPSFFELSVAMAFDYFSNEKIDVAVVEVGLGGRLDSTNIITPEVSVITNISFDHTALLGNTLPLIAAEKAGIIKPGVPVVVGEHQPETASVFEQNAQQKNAPLIFADTDFHISVQPDGKLMVSSCCNIICKGLEPDLKGFYQRRNLLTSIAAIEQLKKKGFELSEQNVVVGLGSVIPNTGLLGRWQKISSSPDVICDTAHNEAGISLITEQLKKCHYDKLHVVFGAVNDKDLVPILKLLPVNAVYYFTRANVDRALDPELLQQQAAIYSLKGKVFSCVNDALVAAKNAAAENDLIFVGGSTFVVAEMPL
jgi:dihydrofolate synthase/folylpolyglutamate synthase